jgi:hypothetical protein
MSALLLTNGQVHRPYNWILSLPTSASGSGANPQLNVVAWPDQPSYESDVANGNMDNGSFLAVDVPGFDGVGFGDPTTIFNALIAMGANYAGASPIT